MVRFSLPEGDGARSLIRIRKVSRYLPDIQEKAGMAGERNLWENSGEGRAYVGEISAAEEMENGYTYFMTHDAKTGDTL
mgnify:CR=1 FL=1